MEEECPQELEVEIDRKLTIIPKATSFTVSDDFKIIEQKNIRVNVIGYTSKAKANEANLLITRKSLSKRFSLDKDNKQYRILLYKDNKFCSMSVVHFK